MKNIKLTIDNSEIEVPENYSVLQACEEMGLNIPRLCFLRDINETSACRLCIVDIDGMRGLKNSCTIQVQDGMNIKTDNKEIRNSVKQNLQLLASNHIFECWACDRETNCEFLDLMRRYNVDNTFGESEFFSDNKRLFNDTSTAITLDSGKCILCGRCVSACHVHTGLDILDFNERGNETYVGPAQNNNLEDSGCIYCGKCIESCPVAAIKDTSNMEDMLEALREPSTKVIVGIDPLVKVTVGEEFDSNIGENVEEKLYASLKTIGVDEVVDTSKFSNILKKEEANILLNRVKEGGKLPIIRSDEPGWINYIEYFEEDYLSHLTSTKSIEEITGAIVKNYYSKELGYHKENIVFVALTPKPEEKQKASRMANIVEGVRDVDFVLTTREYARMLKRQSVKFNELEPIKQFGKLAELTQSSVNEDTYHNSLEETLKTASILAGEKPKKIKFKKRKEFEEAEYTLKDTKFLVAKITTPTIKDFFDILESKQKQYHFVEFNSSLGGWINSGGNPIHTAKLQDDVDIHKFRLNNLNGLYTSKNYTNLDEILYKEFLDSVGSKKAKKVLHTKFEKQESYKNQ
ncbi:MAG: (2Fe-2S)-binding protein [Candidatus Izimaplasma sp.]|nr:(2Fe-2S)-binding protein [Candidatus Izimaplasma bacterium]